MYRVPWSLPRAIKQSNQPVSLSSVVDSCLPVRRPHTTYSMGTSTNQFRPPHQSAAFSTTTTGGDDRNPRLSNSLRQLNDLRRWMDHHYRRWSHTFHRTAVDRLQSMPASDSANVTISTQQQKINTTDHWRKAEASIVRPTHSFVEETCSTWAAHHIRFSSPVNFCRIFDLTHHHPSCKICILVFKIQLHFEYELWKQEIDRTHFAT